MTKTQKIIKYCAISLALLLIVSILYSILGIISNIFGFSVGKETLEYKLTELNNSIDELDIEIDSSMLTFKNGDIFQIETNNDNIKIKESRNKLVIKENNTLFNNNTNEEIIIYVPSSKEFRDVSIEAGGSKLEIDALNTQKLDFDLGAGAINIRTLNVSNSASIDAGAGALLIENGIINNLDLDMGIGKTTLNVKLQGINDIDAGIGELIINLNDTINNYNFAIEKGIGDILVNGESVNNNYVSGLGNNKIDVSGGIGTIKINTLN